MVVFSKRIEIDSRLLCKAQAYNNICQAWLSSTLFTINYNHNKKKSSIEKSLNNFTSLYNHKLWLPLRKSLKPFSHYARHEADIQSES